MKQLLSLLGAFCLVATATAQEVVAVEAQDIQRAFLLNLVLPVRVDYDVQNYKVQYTTADAFGQPDTASGLLTVPIVTENLAFPIAVYNHGTVPDRESVPSRRGQFERNLPVAIGASGYVVVSPDYIGLGDSGGRHPYVHAATEASAGRDMVIAVKKWLTSQRFGFTDQLFITGYSQGGHATAALHRDIELNPGPDSLDVTSATYLSGPYSISDVMVGTIFQEGNNTLPGYIAYTYISYNYVYGLFDSLAQAFVPPYLAPIDSFARQEYNLDEFNVRLDTLLRRNGDQFNAIFQDSIREILRSGAPSHPINQALRDNDTYDWAPTDPTLIYYCTEDEQVPFANAILADSVMRANGSVSVTLESGGALDHGGCVIPAIVRTLEFWSDLAEIRVGLGEPTDRPEVKVSPNPVAGSQTLRVSGLELPSAPYVVYDAAGRQIGQGLLGPDGTVRVPARMPPGMYLLRVGLGNRSVVRRVVVR